MPDLGDQRLFEYSPDAAPVRGHPCSGRAIISGTVIPRPADKPWLSMVALCQTLWWWSQLSFVGCLGVNRIILKFDTIAGIERIG